MEFKDKVKIARTQLFMSQENFAKELGVTFATVNRWETGKHAPSYPAQKAFHDFCKKHNISFEKK
ncbi:MAG: helix-turn-helix domain-containing protein [Christensenellales bacterium]|jgi:DNA-binding transcriptional regulator YiaG